MGYTFLHSQALYYKYRKQVLRCNLFDEYVQMRADELIGEREHMLKGDDMKKWVWYSADLQETLIRCHRQSFKNDASDFADSELLLQDFIRRYSDDTEEKPLKIGKNLIGMWLNYDAFEVIENDIHTINKIQYPNYLNT